MIKSNRDLRNLLFMTVTKPLWTLGRLRRRLKYSSFSIDYEGFIRTLTDSTDEKLDFFQHELESKTGFYKCLKERISRFGYMSSDSLGLLRQSHLLYLIVRILKPTSVLETGVAGGMSSSFILEALKDNGKGRLYSIDLPKRKDHKSSKDAFPLEGKCMGLLPKGTDTGWLIPEELKTRWTLLLGKTSQHLPRLLKKLEQIDIFLHDSEHTYSNMLWEYQTAWPFIRNGGLLLSDDIDFNDAFSEFYQSVNYYCVVIVDNKFGAIRK